MRHYPVGLKWETKGYNCTIVNTSPLTAADGYHWLSHDVEWNPKYGYSIKHIKHMSTKKLDKEFKRLGINPEPDTQSHFDEGLFEL